MKKIILILVLMASTVCAEMELPDASADIWQPLPSGYMTFDAIDITITNGDLAGLTANELINLSVLIQLLVKIDGVVYWDPDLQRAWFKTLLPRIYKEKQKGN
jgi:hypothetical protein